MAESLLASINDVLTGHTALAVSILEAGCTESDLADRLCALVLRVAGGTRLWAEATSVLTDRDTPGCCASAEAASRLRDEGNAAFGCGRFTRAAELYSDSLVHVNEQRHAALAAKVYNNRSLCWLRLGQPQAALGDAALALRICERASPDLDPASCPRAGDRAKAAHRAAAALAAGAQPEQSEEEAQLEADVQALPPLVRAEASAEEGRALAAAAALEPGQVVYEEARPWVSVLLRPHRKTVSWCASNGSRFLRALVGFQRAVACIPGEGACMYH